MGEIWGCLEPYFTVVGGHRSELVAPQRASNPLYRWQNYDPQKFAKYGIKYRLLLSGAASLPRGKSRTPIYRLGHHLLKLSLVTWP